MKIINYNWSLWKLWIAVFIYSFMIAVFIQFIFLPYVIPSWSAGNGLLKNTDGVVFHRLAAELADTIRTKGWSAWQLRPEDQVPAGIASIFYVLIFPDPRIFIPLNAALHASAALILIYLINLLVKNNTKAVFCALPFIFFPSNLQWTAQWHKDGFCILGILLILQCIVIISRQGDYKSRRAYYINFCAIIYGMLGISLIYIARPYLLTMFLPVIIVIFFFLFLYFLVRAFKKKILWRTILFAFLPIFSILFISEHLNPHFNPGRLEENRLVEDDRDELLEYVISEEYEYPSAVEPKTIEPQLKEEAPATTPKKEEIAAVTAVEERQEVKSVSTRHKKKILVPPDTETSIKHKKLIRNYDIENYWRKSSWVPTLIEEKFYSLGLFRRGFRIYPGNPKSSIDINIGFNSVKSVFIYLPRAIQIAFLAPFPNQWFEDGNCPANTAMRKISGFEMTITYFALIFLPYAIWYWRKRIEIWIILVFCLYMMLIYGLIICNIGTLYRMRYPYMTILVALGIAGFLVFLEQLAVRKGK